MNIVLIILAKSKTNLPSHRATPAELIEAGDCIVANVANAHPYCGVHQHASTAYGQNLTRTVTSPPAKQEFHTPTR